MELSVQPGRIYLVALEGNRIPVRAIRPDLEMSGWWICASCRSDTRFRVPEENLERVPEPQGELVGQA